MKCSCCNHKAEVEVSWKASQPQCHKVCETCAAEIWNSLSLKYTGTEAYLTFAILPIDETGY